MGVGTRWHSLAPLAIIGTVDTQWHSLAPVDNRQHGQWHPWSVLVDDGSGEIGGGAGDLEQNH